jgi:hypothetical protein
MRQFGAIVAFALRAPRRPGGRIGRGDDGYGDLNGVATLIY